MTNPRQMPRFGTWSVPNCPLAIEYDVEVLETIRRLVTVGLQAPRGGVEVGGLLLGTYDGKLVRIVGFEPVRCDHELGPRFVLTESDTESLTAQLLAHEGPGGMDGVAVVGWYQSHLRRGLTLSTEDVKIYDRHFPKPWQVALLLRPDPAGGIHARFFLREPVTPIRQTRPKPSAPRVERAEFVQEPVSSPPAYGTAPYSPEALAPLPPLGSGTKRGIQNKTVWTVLAGMFVLAVVSVFYMRFNFAVSPRSPERLPLEAVAKNGGLELRWDPKDLGDVSRGRLEVHDGPSVEQIGLDHSALASGRFIYRQKSDVIVFRIEADRASGAPLEGSAMYVAQNFGSANTPHVVPPAVVTEAGTANPPPALTPPTQTSIPPVAQNDTAKAHAEDTRLPAPIPAPHTSQTPEQPKQLTPPPVVQASIKQTTPPPTESVSTKTQTPTTAAQPKQGPPTTPSIAAPPKQDEPAKPQPEQSAGTPVQTAQTQRPAALDPPVSPPPAIRTEPTTPPPAPRVVPKETSSVPSPAPPPSWRLGGRWSLQSGGYSRSPAVPEAVSITVTENDGSVQGTLEARYKGRSKSERIHFSFSGKMINGAARFSWTSTTGRRGQIEFIHVPNSPDVAEVVWQNPDNNHVFDEMLRRAN